MSDKSTDLRRTVKSTFLNVLALAVVTCFLSAYLTSSAKAQNQPPYLSRMYVYTASSPNWNLGINSNVITYVNIDPKTLPAGTLLKLSSRVVTHPGQSLTPLYAVATAPRVSLNAPCTPSTSPLSPTETFVLLNCVIKLNSAIPSGETFEVTYFFNLTAGAPLDSRVSTLNCALSTVPATTNWETVSCHKVPDTGPCDEPAVIGPNGGVILPAGALDPVGPVDVDEDQGSLADLYPGKDTMTDAFYPLPCDPSIGGALPAGLDEALTPAEIAAEAFLNAFEAVDVPGILSHLPNLTGQLPPLQTFQMAPCSIRFQVGVNTWITQPVPCNHAGFLLAGQPFDGRDIIYVHGLAVGHLKKKLAGYAPASKQWPQDMGEFIGQNGYFRDYATGYWEDHIRENLFDPKLPANPEAGYQWTKADTAPIYKPKSNRYLIVSWSSNQTLEFAQHALLTQIQLAMKQGTNVVSPPTYPKTFSKPFCGNGCILISHSTGGLVVSTAMARAAKGDFGPGGKQVAGLMGVHIAFEPALSGSRLATVGMGVAIASAGPTALADTVLCPIEDALFDTANTCGKNTGWVKSSILRDLIPAVAQTLWGPVLSASRVPTLTVAGSHPIGNFLGLTKIILPGLDDGVLTMNSACANPALVYPGLRAASGVRVWSEIKAFDMGIGPLRAAKNYQSQKNFRGPPPGPGYLAGTCVPYRSATGMILPVSNPQRGTVWDVRQRYANHYSFIQGTIDHSHDGGGDASNRWPSWGHHGASIPRRYLDLLGSTIFGEQSREEMSAITSSLVFTKGEYETYLVHPDFAREMHQIVRGRKITFRLFGKKRVWWIWKRTYHLLNHWEDKASTHYAYEFVARR